MSRHVRILRAYADGESEEFDLPIAKKEKVEHKKDDVKEREREKVGLLYILLSGSLAHSCS